MLERRTSLARSLNLVRLISPAPFCRVAPIFPSVWWRSRTAVRGFYSLLKQRLLPAANSGYLLPSSNEALVRRATGKIVKVFQSYLFPGQKVLAIKRFIIPSLSCFR